MRAPALQTTSARRVKRWMQADFETVRRALMRRDHRVLIAMLRHTNPHRLLKGIYRYAASRDDWNLDSAFHDPTPLQIQDIRERGADGLIVSCSPSVPEDLDFLREYPGIVISLTPDTPWEIAPHVGSDYQFIYARYVDHFQFLGLGRVAYLGLERRRASHEAIPLLQALCTERGLEFSALLRASTPADELMMTPRRPDDIPRQLRSWLEGLPPRTGLLCRSDADGCNLVRAVQVLGRSVPDELAVGGIGDDFMATVARPPLTTFELPHEEIGFQAAALLDRMMKGEPRPEAPIVIRGGRLIVRGSTQQHLPDVQQALAVIRAEASAGLTVKELCGRLGVSRVTLERRFQGSVGHTPGEAIRLGRLDAALKLLGETDLTVERVAQQSGFESTSSFSKFFRERIGHSPGQYRAMQRRKAE